MAIMKYHRYHIETKKAPNIVPHPHRFNVKVNRLGLAKLLIKEMIHYRGNRQVILSRPCVYGVFSGPVGGFAPREKLCVGCLRCTVQYPDIVQISHNPDRKISGDAYFTYEHVDTIVFEAEAGRIPIKGAGYRGKFGGTGWDAMWTDMSEIVRPTRDGIHGREYISTDIDIGCRPVHLSFDEEGALNKEIKPLPTLPLPIIFDIPPPVENHAELLNSILEKASEELQTFAMHTKKYPPNVVILRTGFDDPKLMDHYRAGIRTFHLTADYHGRCGNGKFILDAIREVHLQFVKAGCRNEVTLIGSGGIIAAEHLPKAIICGLDAIALDTPVLVALQAEFQNGAFRLPNNLSLEWGVQRLKNLVGAWRDQLLEILGAMGIREVRRLRGEIGRAMFQSDLEKEAFAGIEGYERNK